MTFITCSAPLKPLERWSASEGVLCFFSCSAFVLPRVGFPFPRLPSRQQLVPFANVHRDKGAQASLPFSDAFPVMHRGRKKERISFSV